MLLFPSIQAAAPTVTTNAASSISYNTTQLNGQLTNDGGFNTYTYFEYGYTTAYGNSTKEIDTYSVVDSEGDGTTDSFHVLCGRAQNDLMHTSLGVTPSNTILVDTIVIDKYTPLGSDAAINVDIYINQATPDYSWQEGTKVKDDWKPDFSSSGIEEIPLDQVITMNGGTNYEIEFYSSDGTEFNAQIRINSDTSSPTYEIYTTRVGFGDFRFEEYGAVSLNGTKNYNNTGDTFNYAVKNLFPETTYHYRSVAINQDGRTNGTDKNFTTLNPSAVNDTTSIGETTATLNGYMHYGDGTGNYGFWLSTLNPTPAAPGTNITVGSGTSEKTYSSPRLSLDEGQYYYYKAWETNGSWFVNSSSTEHFLTKPSQPTSVSSTSNATDITVSWTEGTHAVSNYSTIIRYNTTGYPSSITDGIGGVNTTGTSYKFTGLTHETTYYFSLWSYVNESGSPLLHAYSPSPTTISGATEGGVYNITIRYENVTHGTVNLTHGQFHNLIIHYDTNTEKIAFDSNGEYWSDETTANKSSIITDEENGSISFNATTTIEYIEFHWNDTQGLTKRCNRIIVPEEEQNITFYIRTNLVVYPDVTIYQNQSITKYLYYFIDTEGKFVSTQQVGGETIRSFAYIYKYDSNGTRMIIHSEWITAGNIYPWLVYEDRYYIGIVSESGDQIDRISIAPAEESREVEIQLPPISDLEYTFNDLIEVDAGLLENGFYIHYVDTTTSTSNALLRIWWYKNGTMYNATTTSLSNKNWTFEADTNVTYQWQVIATLDDASDVYDGTYQTGKMPLFPYTDEVTNKSTVDDIFTWIFGKTPVYDDDVEVPWTYIVVFIICFIIMTTAGRLNAFIGTMGVGLTLCLTGGIIGGMRVLFSNYTWWEGPVLLIIGIFLTALSIVGLIGGVESR